MPGRVKRIYKCAGDVASGAKIGAKAISGAADAISAAGKGAKAEKAARSVIMDSSAAAEKIVNANRVGSGLKGDTYHRAASFLTEAQLAKGKTFALDRGTSHERTLLEVEGEVNGKSGVFEYIINGAGEITHQLFKPGGVVDGSPN